MGLGILGLLREELGGDLEFASNLFLAGFMRRQGIVPGSGEFRELAEYYNSGGRRRAVFREMERDARDGVDLAAPVVTGGQVREVQKSSLRVWDADRFERALRIKDYSQATVRSYVSRLEHFSRWLGGRGRSLQSVTDDEIFRYVDALVSQKKVTSIYLRVLKAALHAYFSEVLGEPRLLPMLMGIRKRHALPQVLTKGEVARLLRVTTNLKHRSMLAVMYGSGLRVSEVIKLRVEDINFENLTLRVRMAKGKKDRYSVFSESIIPALQELSEGRRGNEMLFWSNQRAGKAVSARTLQHVFAKAKKKAGIEKDVSCHSMRHSFATHLLEGGTDLRVIQKLLGHKNIQTTTIYTGVARRTLQNVKSPL